MSLSQYGEVSISQIKNNPDIPQNVKDLIINLIKRLHSFEASLPGAIELAYRRGKDARPKED